MIKNIIFDLGKVLIDYDFDIFFQKIGHKPNTRKLEEANREILLFEAGRIDKQTFFEYIKKIYNFDLPFEEFIEYWCNVFWKIPQMLDLARNLKDQGFNLFLLSNTDELHFPFIRNKFSELKIFDNGLMLSYNLGYIKPDLNIYKKALSIYNLNPQKTIFIDDRNENIIAAEKIGIKGILHKNHKETYEQLKKIIKLEDK